MLILGVILARKGSKRLPDKNKKMLNGHPLIYYTIKEALKSDIDVVVVSSDDKDIQKISKENHVECLDRPKELAQDDTPSFLALRHAVLETESNLNTSFDKIVLLQPTSPTRTHKMINKALSVNLDAVLSVHRKTTGTFGLNGALFVISKKVLLSIKKPQKYLIDDLIALPINLWLIVTKKCIDIDTEEDFMKVEKQMKGEKHDTI